MRRTINALGLYAIAAIALPAQVFTTLHSFDTTDGSVPAAALVQAINGDLYGITSIGGANGAGTIFNITPGGTLTTEYNFCALSACADGSGGSAALVQGINGFLYGIDSGPIFKTTLDGTLTVLDSVVGSCVSPGGYPCALMEGRNGDFYMTTTAGVSAPDCDPYGCGSIMRITPSGSLTVLHTFCAQNEGCADGYRPSGPLVQVPDGNFYGITDFGGSGMGVCGALNGCGTFFEMTPNGALTTLYSFSCPCDQNPPDWNPVALIRGADGNYYGITVFNGGTVFMITPTGTLTTLKVLEETTGYLPTGLIQATDGNFYGTTQWGGANNHGVIFEMTPTGDFTTLYSFCPLPGCPDGTAPLSGLVQDTDGDFYGTASAGGTSNNGAVFKLTMGLAPFVKTLLTTGKVGELVEILGTNLAGATSVTFNGTPAAFKVVSSSFIKATVPAGATSGGIQVVAHGATLSSNVPYYVAP